tara:strand:+ start:7 stop:225 length:219 start_codon:yes stop_codon:yes gene_type:complete
MRHIYSINYNLNIERYTREMDMKKEERKHISFQLRIDSDKWDQFKIKSITEKSKTLNAKLTELIEEYVSGNV